MDKLLATSRLDGFDQTIGDTRLRELPNMAVLAVSIAMKQDKKLATAIKTALKASLPSPVKSTLAENKKTRLVSTQADQFFVLSDGKKEGADKTLEKKLKGTGHVFDLSDGWVAIELSGPSSRMALERLSQVDLDASVFALNASARCSLEHMGSIIVRTGKDAFLILSASSSAKSLLHALQVSAQNVS